MASTPSTVSFTVRRPTPVSRPSSSGPESDGPFKVPALPRHLASAGGSAASSPLAGSPRTFSSREDSEDDGEAGIVFVNGPGADNDSHHTDSSDEENFGTSAKQLSGQRCVVCNWSPCFIEVDSQKFLHIARYSSLHQKKKKAFDPDTPLVIPTQPNPDWREAARRRRAACSRVQTRISRAVPSFVPDSALATTGTDGSAGGLGTKDTINSGLQLSGLQINKNARLEVDQGDSIAVEAITVSVDQPTTEVVEETEDQRALRAILAGEDGSAPIAEIIPVPPLSETDALKQDVQDLPDVATADDYERVPISAFGAAMLRGMGWSEGAVAPRSDKRRQNGLKELYLPQARTALLGIGAKEREVVDDGSGKKKPKGPDMRYIPVTRKESGRGENGSSRSGSVSDRERDRGDDRRRRTKDYGERDGERRDHRDKDRDRDVERDRAWGRRDLYEDTDRGKRYDERDRTRDRDRRDRRDGR